MASLFGIHIGSGPAKITPPAAPPPDVANNPQALEAWNKMLQTGQQVNSTIGQADALNKGAMLGAGVALAPVALGALTGGGAAAAGTAAGTAGGGISLSSILSGLKDGAGAVGNFLGNNKGLVDAGLGTAAALNAADLQKQSTNYAKNAQDAVQSSYNERAPLRTAGIAGMLNPQPSVDLSGLGQIASRGNPFASPIPLRSLAQQPAPTAGTPGAPSGQNAILGQSATPVQSQQALTSIQSLLNSGRGGLGSLLNAANAARQS